MDTVNRSHLIWLVFNHLFLIGSAGIVDTIPNTQLRGNEHGDLSTLKATPSRR